MPDYSFNQIKRMEQEALKRAKLAASMAKPPEKPPAPPAPPPPEKPPIKRNSLGFLNALDLKKLIGENSEQALLLLLILIIANDADGDEYLLYALIYIML